MAYGQVATIDVGARSGTSMHTLAARWNGSRWKMLSTPSAAGLSVGTSELVGCSSSTRCVSVIQTKKPQVELWNGSRWARQAITFRQRTAVNAVACSGSLCRIAGVKLGANGFAPVVERNSGSGWIPETTPTATEAGFTGVATSGDRWIVVGASRVLSKSSGALVETAVGASGS